jgi:hypothetical protein
LSGFNSLCALAVNRLPFVTLSPSRPTGSAISISKLYLAKRDRSSQEANRFSVRFLLRISAIWWAMRIDLRPVFTPAHFARSGPSVVPIFDQFPFAYGGDEIDNARARAWRELTGGGAVWDGDPEKVDSGW